MGSFLSPLISVSAFETGFQFQISFSYLSRTFPFSTISHIENVTPVTPVAPSAKVEGTSLAADTKAANGRSVADIEVYRGVPT